MYARGEQTFSTEGNIEDFIATEGRMLVLHTYITSVIALKTSKTFYMSYHKLKVTTVTSG